MHKSSTRLLRTAVFATILPLSIPWAAGASPSEGAACELSRCDAASDDAALYVCVKDLFIEQEQQLQHLDREVMDRMSLSQGNSMRETQLVWLDYREKHCRLEPQLRGKAAWYRQDCLCRTTMQRNQVLEEIKSTLPPEPTKKK